VLQQVQREARVDLHNTGKHSLKCWHRKTFRKGIQVEVFGTVTPCSDVVGYQRLGGPSCLHLQGEVRNIRMYVLCKSNAMESVARFKIFSFSSVSISDWDHITTNQSINRDRNFAWRIFKIHPR